MSNLGKILLVVAAIGAALALVFGWLLIGKYNDTKTNLAATTQDRDKYHKDFDTQKAAAEALAVAKQETETKLTAATAQVADLNGQLTAANSKLNDANTAVAQSKAAADDAQAKLTAITTALNGMSPADLIAARDKANSDLKAAQDEQKVLEDTQQGLQKQVVDLKDAINRKEHGTMPGVSGRVTFVNRTWNFVVLNVGLSSGVVPNGELIVYRGNNFLGKVRVTTVDENSAVADILPDAKGDIQTGDSVLN